MSRLSRFLPDPFTTAIVGTVVLASLLPVRGGGVEIVRHVANVAIALLFFLHGAKLSREAIVAGATHWRLHLLVFSATFVLFPLLGIALRPLLLPWLGPDLYLGFLYLCTLPATVQSAIAFTSIAHGNVAAAVCSAAASSLLGVFITPLLAGVLLQTEGQGGSLGDAMAKITVQLLVPFLAGQIARRFIGAWVDRNRAWLKFVDQSSILLVVYLAFSEAVVQGLWQQVPLASLLALLAAAALLLTLALGATWGLASVLRFDRADRITIVFAGSKKSLATGVPMAQVLFAGGPMGTLLLPLMVFHQLQLMVCAVLARRFAKNA